MYEQAAAIAVILFIVVASFLALTIVVGCLRTIYEILFNKDL